MGRFKNAKQSWRNLMDSTQKKFSRGAASIIRIVSWARGDNWRRRQKVKKDKHD